MIGWRMSGLPMFFRSVVAKSVFMAMDMGVACHGRGAGFRMTGWRITGLAMSLFLGIVMAMTVFMVMDMGVSCHAMAAAIHVRV